MRWSSRSAPRWARCWAAGWSFGWQWVFWFNVPLGVLGTAASLLVLRDVTGARRHQGVDWRGNLVFLVALTGLLVALSMGGIEGWTHPAVVAGAVLFVLATPLFFWLQNTVTDPLLDLTLFRNRLFAVANLTQFLNGLARMGLLFLLVFFFQGPEGKSPVMAGVLVLPLPVGMFLFSPISGFISDHIGSRLPSSAGLVLSAVGLLGMAATLSVGVSYPLLALWLGITGAGAGLFNSPNASSIMASVPAAQRGVASGIRMLVAFTGSMISIAFVLAIVTSSLPKAAMLRIFSGVASGLPLAEVSPFITGVRVALLILGVVSLLTAPLSLMRGAEQSRRVETVPFAAA